MRGAQNGRVTAGPSALRVRVLGGFAIDGIADTALGSRKARLLLKVLALARGTPVSVATLAEVVWPDGLPSRPGDQVGVLVSRLRRAIGSERLGRTEAGYCLHADWLDVDELRSLTEEASTALHEGRLAAARAASRAALELARGPLLPDDDGTWLEADRAHAATLAAQARGIASVAALRAGDHVGAETLAELALVDDPYDEVALRVLMQAHVAGGRPASALAAYARARRRLADDLGVSPTAETEALHTAVLQGGADPGPAPRGQRRLVGRTRELERLDAALAATVGGARVVAVVGEAGIGKTVLVHHFSERAVSRGARSLAGAADELGRDLPLQPVLDAIGVAGGDARGGRTDVATTVGDASADRDAWFERVLQLVCPTGAPTVLTLDDVQWADATTFEWLRWVIRRPLPLLVVVTTRPGTVPFGADELVVGPLDVAEIADVVDVDLERAADLQARSGGNPLFALALADAAQGELPRSVHDVVGQTLAALDPATADLLRVGAVLGAIDDVDLLADVARTTAIDVIEHLERAVTAGLLTEWGSGFEFRHAVVREAVASTVGVARRALLHRNAARVLDERPQRDPLGIAVHARLGGAMDIAAGAFAEAADVSLARADLEGAEAHLRASIHACESAAARTALARVLMTSQRWDEAAVEAERAIALGAGPEAFEVAGWIEYYRRDYGRAQRFADEAVERSLDASPVLASALALGGRIRHGAGDPGGAESRLTAARDGPPGVRALAEVWLGQVRIHQGRPDEALDLVEHALIDPVHIAHPFAPLHGRLARVMALGQLGRVADAMRACDQLRTAVDAAGAAGVRFRAVELNVRSWLLRGVGRFDEADELSWSAVELNGAVDGSGPSPVGFAEAYWVAFLDLADGHLARGDVPRAADVLGAIATMRQWNGTMAWHQRHRLDLLEARVAAAAGDRATAAELAAAVHTDARARGSERYAALAHVRLVLARPSAEPAELAPTLDVLRRCAALELPGVLDELAGAFGDDRWRDEAAGRRRALTPSP